MDFEDLHTFAIVARLQSFSRAATQLRVAQSALSRRVQRLEYQFGTTLLERHSRGARPTEAGVILLGKVERLEDEIKQIQHDMLSLKDNLVGEIRLALPHGVIQFLGSNIVEKYRERCPDVKLSIVEGKSSNNYDAVVDGIVDAGMVYAPEEGAEVNVLPLFFERRLVIGPIEPGKDIASIRGFETYPATKLSLLPLILPSRPHHIRLAVEDAARKCGIALNVALDIDGLSALKTMVRNGLGYTVLPYGPVHMEITAGTLAAIPIVNPTLECMVGIVYRKDRQSSRALAGLIAVIRDIVQALGHTRFWRPAESSDSEVVEPNGEWE